MVAAPRVLRPCREQRVGAGRADGVQAGVEIGDVLVVGVEPVERVLDVARGSHEVLRVSHLRRLVELLEAQRRVELVHVRRAQVRVDDRLVADRRAGEHDPVGGALRLQRHQARGRRVSQVRLPRLGAGQRLHLDAVAVEQIEVGRGADRTAAGVAQRDRERVDDVLAGGGRRPHVVASVAELHIQVDAWERGAVGIDPRPVDVLLHQDLGRVIGHLRTHHGERVPAGAVRGVDQQRVGHAALPADQAADDRAG